jgi:acyl transferase domain-containing protein
MLCPPTRKQPLLIGAVKSIMGHAEPASAMCSLVKVLMAMQRNCIPPNLYFEKPNKSIPGLAVGVTTVVCNLISG